MKAIIPFIITFLVGFAFKANGSSPNRALALACLIMPASVLIAEFILPHKDGGSSMWPIALIFGTIYGFFIGLAGVIAGAYFLRWKLKHSNKSK